MLFLILGVVLLLLKYFALTAVAEWPWWVVLAPFGLAVLWWSWADWSGYTRRKAAEREDERKETRINKGRARMGLPPLKKR
ncbi:MAG: TIGR04438 family Trp-rich protein [Serpentinimonas sp.]|jgi:small Trp-rich protein|nr:TIGR04438 family Trp-rich protein [Serpentinimonas sp.]